MVTVSSSLSGGGKPQSKKSVWADLPRRLTTISIGVPFVVYLLAYPFTCQLFFHAVHALCGLEWTMRLTPYPSRVPAPGGQERRSLVYFLCTTAAFMTIGSGDTTPSEIATSSMVAVILLVAAVAVDYSFFFVPATGLELERRWNVIWHGVSGGFYLAWSFRCLRLVALESLWNIVWLLLVVWNCDTGCLLAGRCLGHKERSLLPRLPNIWLQWLNKISPNKSTIGMLGGLILGTLTAVLLYGPPSQQLMTRFFAFDNNQEESISSTTVSFGGRWHEMELWERTRVGFQLSILAILGDLMESVVKRRASKKDSGSLVPGHGGILDRFDSSLLSGIFFYHFILQPHNDDG